MLGKIVAGLGARRLVTAVGGAAARAAGTLSALRMAANTLGSTTQATADASKEKTNAPATNVIYVNFGMAGSAGKQKVAGGGTLPARSNVAKPQVSEKMPTEALLDTAVKYLESIDKSLKNQLEFEKRSYEQQARDEREAIVENKPSFSFSDIKDKFSNLKSNVSEGSSLAGKLAKYALGLGALAAVVASSIDQTQLDALKQNVDDFKKSFGWLGEIGAAVGAGGLLGFLFGGRGVVGRLKGGLVGMVASHVVSRLYPLLFGGSGGTIDPETGEVIPGTEPAKESRSMSALEMGMSLGAGAFAVGYGIKKFRQVRASGAKMSSLRTAARSGTASQAMASVKKGDSWLASKRGRKFLALVAKKLGQKMFSKIARTLGRIAAMLLLGATGVGAIPAIIGIIASVGFLAFDLVDIATAIWDSWNESKEEDTAADAAPAAAGADATPAGGSNATSFTASTNGQNKTITGVTDGGRGYTTVTYADGTSERRTGTLPARTNNPGNIMYGDIAKSYGAVGSSPSTNGPPVAVFPTAEMGFKAMDGLLTSNYSNGPIGQTIEAWATDPSHPAKVIGTAGVDPNKKYTDFTQDEKTRFQQALAKVEGFYAAGSGPSVSSAGGGFESSVGAMATAGIRQVGQLLGTLGSAVIKPGIARSFEPTGGNVASQINSESMKLQTDLTLGVKNQKAKDLITTPAMPGKNPGVPGPVKSISSMDPNYSNVDVLSQYLGHFKKAA